MGCEKKFSSEVDRTLFDILGDSIGFTFTERYYAKTIIDSKLELSSEHGKISYVRNGNRYKLTVIRFLTRKLKLIETLEDNLDDFYGKGKWVKITPPEKLTKSLAQRIYDKLWPGDIHIKLLKGWDVVDAYGNEVGNSSCMTGYKSDITELYALNPDKVGLLVARQKNNSARCLLWTTDSGKLYADRIYGNDVCLEKALIKVLLEDDIIKYGHVSTDSEKELIVSDLEFNEGFIPYMDSFTFGTVKNEKLTISYREDFLKDENAKVIHCLVETDGNGQVLKSRPKPEPKPTYSCFRCGFVGDSTELFETVDGHYVCNQCFSRTVTYTCCNCGMRSEYPDNFLRDGQGNLWCLPCHDAYFVYCTICEKPFMNSDSLTSIYSLKSQVSIQVCDDCYNNRKSTIHQTLQTLT